MKKNFDYTGKLGDDGFFKHEDDVHEWCQTMSIHSYEYKYSEFHKQKAIFIDKVYKNIEISLEGILGDVQQLPVRFESINGALCVSNNKLTSLKGFPPSCDAIFIGDNPLNNFEDLPKEVRDIFLDEVFFKSNYSIEDLIPLIKVNNLFDINLPIRFEDFLKQNNVHYQDVEFALEIRNKSIPKFIESLRELEKTVFLQKNHLIINQNKKELQEFNNSFKAKFLIK